MKKNSSIKFLIYPGLLLLVIICITPFGIMLINATRSSTAINKGISLIPGNFFFINANTLAKAVNMYRGLLNSTIVAVSATLLNSYVGALAAFSFAFYRFPLKKFSFTVILVLMMIPPHLGLIGYFELLNKLNLLDTLAGIILPGVASAFTVFFLRQYIKTAIHESLLQSARIDGASEIMIFHKIALPLMKPGIATMAIFTFVANWNNYILPLVVIFSQENYTVPMMIAKLNSTAYQTDFGSVYLGVAISVIPIIIAFSIFSKYIIAGLSMGGVKE